MRRIAPALVVLAAVLLAAACGSGDGGSASPTTTGTSTGGGGGQSLQIGEKEWALDPSSPSVSKAGTVTIHVVNDGSFGHALEIEGNGVEEEIDEIGAGGSADLTVDLKPGTYEIYCPISDHRQKGMEGTLTVAGGGGSGGGGTTTGSDDSGGYGYG
jgi:uncharacterized cupredoxin-like copper-binding protein